MSKKWKIGLDFDNVLADTTKTYLQIYNKLTNHHYVVNDITDYEMSVLPKEDKELLSKIWFLDELWENIQPIKESQKYVSKILAGCNCELYVVTASHYEMAKAKGQFLEKYFPFIPTENLIIAHEKRMINIDILIDDNIINIKPPVPYYWLLFNQPWNQDKKYDSHRVFNWEQVYNFVMSYINNEKYVTSCIAVEKTIDCYACLKCKNI